MCIYNKMRVNFLSLNRNSKFRRFGYKCCFEASRNPRDVKRTRLCC